jgi:cellulose biosynthesis protein BcsQ
MIGQAIGILIGKGGVGKTSLAAGIGAMSAASGWRVLMLDLDPQGNLAREFGYTDRSDGGEALYRSVLLEEPLEVLEGVRPNLDVIAGGPRTRLLADHLLLDSMRSAGVQPPDSLSRLCTVLENVAKPYSLVIIDGPPGQAVIHQIIATLSHFLLVPTTGDSAALDGLSTTLTQIVEARSSTNPDLELLGVALMFIPSGATALEREVRADVRRLLGDDVSVFNTTIRQAKKAALDVRRQGIQAYEYEELKSLHEAAHPWYKALDYTTPVRRFSSAASGLAGDYQQLTNEVLTAFVARQQELGYL